MHASDQVSAYAYPSENMHDSSMTDDRRGASTRDQILDVIRAEPGIDRSTIMRRADVAWSTVGHHLHALQKDGLIDIVTIGRNLRAAPRGFTRRIDPYPELLAPLARQVLTILNEVAMGRGPSQISRLAGSTPRRVQAQLAVLGTAGLVTSDAAYHPSFRLTELGADVARHVLPATEGEALDAPRSDRPGR